MILSRGWRLFLILALLAGIFLRTLHVADMEYKEDEQYHYFKSQTIGHSEPWPWIGIPSGVYLVNPGMSVWVFAGLAKATGAHSALELERALQWLSLLGICGLLLLTLRFLGAGEPREAWLWATALALVNPFQILYQRKLWPEPFFPFFTTLLLLAWCRREKFWGAFVWGLVGAMLGQIHMSGFFFAFAIFLWSALSQARTPSRRVHWGAWVVGSCAGAWPLIPWALYVVRNPLKESMTVGWEEISQFKFWAFWATDAIGLHLGNPLGLLRGNSNWAQISDFVRYPLIAGRPSYVVGVAHATALLSSVVILVAGIFAGVRRIANAAERRALGRAAFGASRTETGLLLAASLIGCGALLTVTGVNIRRYYMMVEFPLEFVTLAWIALTVLPPRMARASLGILWASQLIMSGGFVDYGDAYHVVIDKRPDLAFPK